MKTIIRTFLLIALIPAALLAVHFLTPKAVRHEGSFVQQISALIHPRVAEAICVDFPCGYDGVCGASHYLCSKGSSISQVDGATSWTWTCTGSGIGGNDVGCYEAKPAYNGACAATHFNCSVGSSINNVTGSTAWTWSCAGAGGGSTASCSENIPHITSTPYNVPTGGSVSVAWDGSLNAYCKVSVCPATGWYQEWVGVSGSFSYTPSLLYGCGSPTFSLSCGPNSSTLTVVATAHSEMSTDGSCGLDGKHYGCYNGSSINNAAGATAWTWNCTGTNLGSTASCTEYYPVNGACGATNNSCTAGTWSDVADSGTQYLWNCNGQYGGTNASCVLNKPVPNAPSIGGQTSPIINTSYPYTFQASDPMGQTVAYNIDWDNNGTVDQTSAYSTSNWVFSQNNSWASAGAKTFKAYTSSSDGRNSGWNSYTVTVPTPVNGTCNNSTINACSAGTFTDLADDANYNYWYCAGQNGGSNSATCSYPKTNGVCSTTVINGCTSGSFVDMADDANNNYWYCAGSNNGVNSPTCAIAKINGACATTHYGCTTGTSASNVSGPTTWTWVCNGANNGTNSGTCSESKPPPSAPTIGGPTQGQISTSYTFTFQATNPSGDGVVYAIDWDNNGTVDQYLPATGTTVQGTQLSAANNWAGSGVKTFKARTETNGGPVSGWTSYSIQIYGVPTVIWTPGASATIAYNSTFSFGYTSTDSVSCSYYDLNPSTGAIQSTIWSNGATSSSWTNAGPYQADFRRRVVCQNPFSQTGSAEIYVTVLQNNAACGTFTVPSYVTPGQVFSGTITMVNTGTNPWLSDANSGTPHRLGSQNAQDNTTWGISRASLPVNVPAGNTGTFTANFTAPTTAGDYSFSWKMVEEAVQWFGVTCDPSTTIGNKIRVKNPQLAVLPANYGFPDQVIGDPANTVLLHVSNLGGGNIAGGNITGFSGPFTCTSSCTFALGPGETKDISISFAPSATGTYSTTLHVNATGQTSVDVTTYGNGIEKLVVSEDPNATVSMNPLDFGESATTRPKYLNFTIKNQSLTQSGGTVSGITPDNPVFTCVSGCSFTLPPSSSSTVSSQAIRLKFIPTVLGTATSNMTINTTPPLVIGLTGVGVKPAFTTQEK